MGKTFKDFKKDGKDSFDAPKVKQRKHFAPGTKTEKPKKGKGSYGRKNAFEEDEQNLSDRISKELEKYPDDDDANIDSLKKVINKRGGMPKMSEEERKKMIKKKPTDEDEQSCWKGYKKKGTKKKGGKTVNNCVKESASIIRFIEAIMSENHAEAHKHLKDAVNQKIQTRIAQEIDKPLF